MNSAAAGASEAAEPAEGKAEAPDLTGVWHSTEDSVFVQRATIAGTAMTIDWVPQDGSPDSRLYWVGTYEAPEAEGSHAWTSTNDHSRTRAELLASSADTKDFTYEDGKISYEVSALGESGTVALEQTSAEVPADAADSVAAPGEIEVLESGIAVDGDYVWVSAVVRHEGLTGEFATVLYNVYDDEDNLIVSQEQVEELGTEGATFPIGTQLEIPAGSAPARVEATVSVSDYGSNSEARAGVAPIQASADDPQFLIQNTTDENWEDPRIQILCRDDAGEIAGGGSEYPNMIPAGGKFLLSDAHLITSDDAASCEAYVLLPLAM
ncbi:hypothetical protein [Brachybacterium vulturis]|uniref:hypothetical protein n=1 Tax=Brachybacterium vulturis TaxID=2017484 RepID=UPI0015AC8E98|nr:hypothetical protein [Brachybacterium vulturis]